MSVKTSSNVSVLRTKFILSVTICAGYCVFGIAFSIVGPTLPGIAQLLHSDIEEVSYALTLRQILYGIAAFSMGFIFKFASRRHCFTLSLLGLGIAMGLMPFCRNINEYLAASAAFAFADAALEVGLHAWMLELWQTDASVYMQTMHFCYAMGLTIGPLITEPYLEKEIVEAVTDPYVELQQRAAGLSPVTQHSINIHPMVAEDGIPQLAIPYLISSAILFAMFIINVLLSIYVPFQSDPVRRESKVQQSVAHFAPTLGHKLYACGVISIVCCCSWMIAAIGK